ncbi:MAG TPA: ATPase, T2SS/T4P/T4SS family [Stellaceae bacterium]|nr:ATPase, T2SS/T4P/T4SS family [Stellaceae bacterium]
MDAPAFAAKNSIEAEIGEVLVASGKLSQAGLERALRLSSPGGERFLALLSKLGLVSERDVAEALAARLGLALAGPSDFPDAPPLEELGANFLRHAKVLPLADEPQAIHLAMADPLDEVTIRAIELKAQKRVVPRIATVSDIEAALERLYPAPGTAAIAAEPAHEAADAHRDVERLKDLASGAPVIRLANQLIARAVELRASDIHIEPREHGLAVRYRIDGALQDMEAPPAATGPALVSRLKIMARLDIAERRLPQDGRIRVPVRGRQIDMRVSTVPTINGENVVLRVLDRASVELEFAKLGFDGALEESFLKLLDQPNGILLVTGPTGSGKTTTLYTSLRHLNLPDKKLFSVEDPVEYQLDGVSQVEVRPHIGMSFAHVLRSILRQDPDIIMVGEIRDRETAEIAIQAALTGHLVLSTLHTNSAAGTVTRLLDMGIPDYLLTSTLNGIEAQRLVRRLCTECREAYEPVTGFLEQIGAARPAGTRLWRARGCASCNGTGFRGRVSIVELMPMSPALRRLVLAHAETQEIEQTAVAEGMRTMFQSGLALALGGTTTVEEVLRATRAV